MVIMKNYDFKTFFWTCGFSRKVNKKHYLCIKI